MGVCTVGYTAGFTSGPVPVIICGYRFYAPQVRQVLPSDYNFAVRETIQREYYSQVEAEKVLWVPEVSLEAAGSVDYVVVDRTDLNNFLCVEFQAAGTTGTPWEAVLEFQKTGKFSKDRYDFGINWANEFSKTMMQQAYKKGVIMESWHRRIVFAIQEVGMTYLELNSDASGLHEKDDRDAVHFCTFNMAWIPSEQRWGLRLARKLSTDAEGVRKMLSGTPEGAWPTEAGFVENIVRKMRAERLGPSSQAHL